MHEFFERISGVQRLFFECIRKQIGTEGVHPRQGPILGMLLLHDGMSQVDIVHKLQVSAATVAVSISRLEKLGFVTRQRRENNQRANILTLTEKGRAEALRMQQLMREIGKVALEDVSEEEIAEMEYSLGKITKNLQKKYGVKECAHRHVKND